MSDISLGLPIQDGLKCLHLLGSLQQLSFFDTSGDGVKADQMGESSYAGGGGGGRSLPQVGR